jgi:hypothetical protein
MRIGDENSLELPKGEVRAEIGASRARRRGGLDPSFYGYGSHRPRQSRGGAPICAHPPTPPLPRHANVHEDQARDHVDARSAGAAVGGWVVGGCDAPVVAAVVNCEEA